MDYNERRVFIVTLSNIFFEDVEKGVNADTLKESYINTYGRDACQLIFKRLEMRGLYV